MKMLRSMVFKPIFRWGRRKLLERSTDKAGTANIPIPLGGPLRVQQEARPLFPPVTHVTAREMRATRPSRQEGQRPKEEGHLAGGAKPQISAGASSGSFRRLGSRLEHSSDEAMMESHRNARWHLRGQAANTKGGVWVCRLLPFLPKAACESKLNRKQRGGVEDEGGEMSQVSLPSSRVGGGGKDRGPTPENP